MTINDLTQYQIRRFRTNNKCKICNKEINNEDFEMVTVKKGKLVNYSFFHVNCLLSNSNDVDNKV